MSSLVDLQQSMRVLEAEKVSKALFIIRLHFIHRLLPVGDISNAAISTNHPRNQQITVLLTLANMHGSSDLCSPSAR